jgi:hypothetical protein
MNVLLCRNCDCVLGLSLGTLRRHGLNAVEADIIRALKRESPRLSYNKHETTISSEDSSESTGATGREEETGSVERL